MERREIGALESIFFTIVVVGTLLIIVIAILLIARFIFRVLFGRVPEYANKDVYLAGNSVPAEVVKRTIYKGDDLGKLNMGLYGGGKQYMEFFVDFKLEDGTVVQLKVPQKQFARIREGDIGSLSFREHKFIKFKKQYKEG